MIDRRGVSQLRSKLARGTALLALASIAPSVSTLAVATVTTVAAATAERPTLTLTLAAEHSSGRGVGSLLLDVGGRDDLGGEVQPFAEVVEALGGQGVVVVLPRELGLDIAAGVERLQSLDDEEVLGVDIGVLGEVEVLLRDEDALAEEVLVGKGQRVELLASSAALVRLNTSWIFLRSALGINIVAVGVRGRC